MLDKNIDTIIFDFGGVLLNLNKQACVAAFAKLGCHKIEELIDNYKQKGLFLLFEEGKISNEEFFEELSKLVGENISREQMQKAYLAFLSDLPQKKLDLILSLKKKYKVLMLSNINQFIFEYCHAKYFENEVHHFSDFFDKAYLSYQMGICKPDESIFQMMIDDFHLIPQNCFYLDDGAANIAMATKLGFSCYQPKPNEDFCYLFD